MTDLQLPRYWGYNFSDEHNAKAMAEMLSEASAAGREDTFLYLELGLGNCGTINAVDFIVCQMRGYYGLHGVEIESWHMKYMLPQRAQVFIGGRDVIPSRLYDFVLIDACHCADCVMKDFEAIEPLVVTGGIVAFHDTNPECQGVHKSEGEHQKNGIEVRDALCRLDLLGAGERPGWKFIRETPGTPPHVHGLAFFRKL